MNNAGLLKLKSAAGAAVAAAFLSGPAMAEDGVDFQLGAASQYIGKGVSKSDGEPAVSGTVEVRHAGAYASVFASTAKLSQGSDSEILSTIGYRTAVAGYALDTAVIYRVLPGTQSGVDSHYTEFQTDVSRNLGLVATRLRVNYTADGFAATKEAWWIELQGGVTIDARTKASAAIATRQADGGAEYTAWNAGVKRRLTDHLALDVRWFDTDGHSLGDTYDGRLVAALAFNF